MELKKSLKADISRYRMVFFLLGMCLSLSFVYGVINYKKYEIVEEQLDAYVYSEDEFEVEQTQQEEKPPPPPEAPPVIEIVEDDVIIEDDQPEIEDIEIDDDTKIDDFIPLPVDDEPVIDEPLEFYQVQEKAKFQGGDEAMIKFIQQNIVVPELAVNEGQSGTVLVSFVVEKNGQITNVKVDPRSRTVGFGCEEAAVDVVKKMSGMWSPALQRDKPVRMRFAIPVKFSLN
ncbi:MAG: TonB family protein [Bacteroidetes bacterium]|nr:TonB family protein [Bacteroidota bacterium]